MKKIVFLALFTALASGYAFAQNPPEDPNAWKTTVEAGLGLNQSSYSDNWAGGEVGSIIWAANLHATAQKQLSSISNWLLDKPTTRIRKLRIGRHP